MEREIVYFTGYGNVCTSGQTAALCCAWYIHLHVYVYVCVYVCVVSVRVTVVLSQ